jgi:hypothetical protein
LISIKGFSSNFNALSPWHLHEGDEIMLVLSIANSNTSILPRLVIVVEDVILRTWLRHLF